MLAISMLAVVSGCGTGDIRESAPRSASEPVVERGDYVASPTLQEGASQQLFAIPLMGRFRASCTGPARAEISYKVARDTADQFITTENRISSNSHLKPGQRVAVAIGREIGPRSEWQIALFSAGGIKVATGSFAVARLTGSKGCFVSGKAEVAERQHSSGRRP